MTLLVKHTTHLGDRYSDQGLSGPNSVSRSSAKGQKESMSILKRGTKDLRMDTNLGSCGLYPKRHGLGIVVQNREGAIHVPSKRPWKIGKIDIG